MITVETDVQAAMDAAAARGGDIVWCPPGEYRVRNLWARHHVILQAIPGTVVFKLPDGMAGQLLGNEWQWHGVAVNHFQMHGIIFDGNAENYDRSKNPASAVAFAGLTNFVAKECVFRNATGYGLGIQAIPQHPQYNGPQHDIYLERCQFINNGFSTDALPGSVYDGLDFKNVDRATIMICHSAGNANDGMDFRGRAITVIAGTCEGNGGAGMQITASVPGAEDTEITIIGGHADGNTLGGYSIASGSLNTGKCRVSLDNLRSMRNITHGVELLSGGQQIELGLANSHIYENLGHGLKARVVHRGVLIDNNNFRDNGGSGMYIDGAGIARVANTTSSGNARYGYEESPGAVGNTISPGCDFRGNGLGEILPNTWNKQHVLGNLRY